MPFSLFCWLNRHKPDRRKASWDGTRYVSVCRMCGAPVQRTRSGIWVRDRSGKG